MSFTPDGEEQGHRTVTRIVNILEHVSAAPHGVRLNELAEALGAPKSSIHGLLKGLVNESFLAFQDNTYHIGVAVDRIAPLSKRTLIQLADTSMTKLLDSYNETIVLSTLVGGTLTYIATKESTHPIRFVPPHNRPRHPRPSASLKILLAESSDRDAMLYLSNSMGNREARDALTELDTIRSTGIAFNRGETYEGMSAAAAAIRTVDGVVACLSMGGVTERMAPALEDIGQAVLAEAQELSREYSALTREH